MRDHPSVAKRQTERHWRWRILPLSWLTPPLCLAGVVLLEGCVKTSRLISYLPKGNPPILNLGGAQNANLPPISYGIEEVWILARSDPPAAPSEEAPGSGALLATFGEKEVPIPLKHTDVHAFISGYVGTVEVNQQFLNPYSRKIEALYVFPLPHNAAINEFIMTIGERRIRGIIRERKEAEQLYQDARQQGYV